MKKVELKISEPMFSCFHSIASAGIAASINETSDNWYFNNTIQWHFNRKFLLGYTGFNLRVVKNQVYDNDILTTSDFYIYNICDCVIPLIKNLINEKIYVFISGIDDYCVKNKCWYQKRHFRHNGLIVGYDDTDDTFICMGYNENWVYTTFKTPQKCIEDGYISAILGGRDYFCLTGLKHTWKTIELDTALISKNLKEYLDSDIEKYPVNQKGMAYGVVAYDYIIMYLEKLMSKEIEHQHLDRRIFRMLWEHKRCMLLRIQAIEKKYGWNNSLSEKYEPIVTKANTIRNMYAMHCQTFSISLLKRIIKIIPEIKKTEIEILKELTQKIDKELNSL